MIVLDRQIEKKISKKACLFLNGQVGDLKKIGDIISGYSYDMVIGVDGGSNYLRKLGIGPDYVVGDLDSIDSDTLSFFENKKTEFKKYPSKKNETDTELAIWLAQESGASHIDLYGALGARVDHEIANIYLLYYILEKGMIPRIVGEGMEINIVKDGFIDLCGKADDLVSIIPLMGDAKGVTLEGLEYKLDNYNMKFSVPRGISNVMLKDSCRVSIKDGVLLVVKYEV